jgi:hypothetical protein
VIRFFEKFHRQLQPPVHYMLHDLGFIWKKQQQKRSMRSKLHLVLVVRVIYCFYERSVRVTAMLAYLVPGTWYLVLDKVGICWNGEHKQSNSNNQNHQKFDFHTYKISNQQ